MYLFRSVSFFSETPAFIFTFPRPYQSTLSGWTAASAIVQTIQRPTIPAKDYTVDFSGGDARKAIQDAADKADSEGGGRVIIPAGEYFCKGAITLKSCVDLHLDEGAKIPSAMTRQSICLSSNPAGKVQNS